MTVASGTTQEILRLARLQDYNILDTLPESSYDDIVKLVAHVCQAPTALVSLIDANRQWFKAKVGLEASESSRDVAFCAHTIQHSGIMVVEDTHQSPRFCDNPLVTGVPYIRFYAGAPLITPDGHALGSLCVIDYQPRRLSKNQLQALEVLSHQVVAHMELSRQASQLKSSNAHLEQRVQERTAVLSAALRRLLTSQTKRLKREATARHNSRHDPLTGLANRSYFKQQLEKAIQRSCRRPNHLYAVIFIDLDNFKPVNDTWGREVGDRLLQHIADQIKRLLHKSDLVARFGGDKFAVLLDNIPDKQHVLAAVKRLQAQLRTPLIVEGRHVSIGASMSITFSSLGYRQPEAALKDADTAMYQAKRQARQQLKAQLKTQRQQQTKASLPRLNSPILIQADASLASQHFSVFDATMESRAQARTTMEEQLRQALLKNQFSVYYQPIFDLIDQSLTGFQVLLRWHHPTRGCLDAEEFIAIAAEIGIIQPLYRQVIQSACQQLHNWQRLTRAKAASSTPPRLALSLQTQLPLLQLNCPILLSTWQTHLEKHSLSASHFQLEISEQIFISNNSSITKVLQQLRALGFGFCVGNFGQGHSSLSRLHELEVSTLKIDRAFVQDLTLSGRADIVKTIVDIGRSTHIDVIAEGIETAHQLRTLLRLGCRFGQGHWLSEALPAIAVAQAFETHQ